MLTVVRGQAGVSDPKRAIEAASEASETEESDGARSREAEGAGAELHGRSGDAIVEAERDERLKGENQ